MRSRFHKGYPTEKIYNRDPAEKIGSRDSAKKIGNRDPVEKIQHRRSGRESKGDPVREKWGRDPV